MADSRDQLRLNVGFIIHQTVGYCRDFPIEIPGLRLADLDLENLDGTARVTRTAQGLLVQVRLTARTQVECGRCLEIFSQSLQIEYTDLYAFTPDSMTESGLLVPESGKINLEPIVRDEMSVAVPISPICRPDCQGLCPICGENRNLVHCMHGDEPGDHRLAILKSLLDEERESSAD